MPMEEEIDLSSSDMKTPPRSKNTSSETDDTYVKQLYKKYPDLGVLITPETLKRTMPNKNK